MQRKKTKQRGHKKARKQPAPTLFCLPSESDQAIRLLRHVVDADLDGARAALKEIRGLHPNSSIITLKASCIEQNQRYWRSISAIEFAA